MTGSGKTVSFINLITTKNECTLILVHTTELAEQTRKAVAKFTNVPYEDTGLLGNGQFDVKPISVGLHQTINTIDENKLKEVNDMFGMIISDETQILGAETFYSNMCKLTAKNKFGFSATPYRDDGLTDVIHFAVGPSIHKVPKSELVDVLIKPDILFLFTDYFFPLIYSSDYQFMISDLSKDPDRNDFIVKELLTNYKDNFVCLLCNRIEQIEQLKLKLGSDAEVLISSMTKKKRKEVMEDLLTKKTKYIISSYALFSAGIDIPHLDVLFLCCPIKSEVKLKQAAGRLMRKSEGKTKATIVDFVDKKISLLEYHFKKRKQIYNKL
jgi:superfamily II DNA or RNA helicase